MWERDPINRAALAVLVVPLSSDRPSTDLPWHRWEDAFGEPGGLDANVFSAERTSPFKRYPPSKGAYFNPHVERLLFPRADDPGERWLCCPEELGLAVSWEREQSKQRARIDLLEFLTVPGREDCAFGLLHLSLEPDESEDPDPLWWAWAIRSKFRRSTSAYPHLQLCQGRDRTDLEGKRPLRELVRLTLGSPHRDLERRLYTAVITPYPEGCEDGVEQTEWRQAIADRAWTFPPAESWSQPEQSTAEQTFHLGRSTTLVQGDATVLTLSDPITKGDARNFRSYWSESLLAGLLQHDCLEDLQGRLAGLGKPVKPDIEPLYKAWLDFRNLVWWSQLSTSTSVPQEFLMRLREARGTERLFSDLEGDLAIYSAQRRSVVEDKQAAALRNLQAGGAAVAVLAPLLAIVAMTGAHGVQLRDLVVASVLIAVAIGVLVFVLLRPRG